MRTHVLDLEVMHTSSRLVFVCGCPADTEIGVPSLILSTFSSVIGDTVHVWPFESQADSTILGRLEVPDWV